MTNRFARTVACYALFATSFLPSAAHAELSEEVLSCRASVVSQASAYAQLALRAVRECADQRAQGGVASSVDCTDPYEAADALGSPLPASVFENDPASGACATVTPAAALYTSCPEPCAALSTTDWTGVGACMQCVLEAEVGDYAADTAGNALSPVAPAERSCIKASSSGAARIATLAIRANDLCQRKGGFPNWCEIPSGKTGAKIRKARSKASLGIAKSCATADFSRIAGCATSLSDAGCVVTSAERHTRDIVGAVSRLIAAAPVTPSSTFTKVLTDWTATCALRDDATAMCWGHRFWPEGSLVESPVGRFEDMSYSCWLRDDGAADCRGYHTSYSSLPPTGTFESIDGQNGDEFCTLAADGSIVCWSRNSPTYSGNYTQFSGTANELCAIRPDATLHCWSHTGYYNDTLFEYERPGSFVRVTVGRTNCAIRTDGTLDCWAYGNVELPSPPPADTFQQVETGYMSACGIRTDETLSCWHWDLRPEISPPAGTFRDLSLAFDAGAGCGVRTDGTLACWGWDSFGRAKPPGEAVAVSSSDNRCSIRLDGSIDCWGGYEESPAAPPSGTFTDVAAGSNYACGIATDQSITCWPYVAPPAGSFVQLWPGYAVCGLRTDGTVACVGSPAPSGTFSFIDEGYQGEQCGIRQDGTLACWAYNGSVSTPLPGTFTGVASGESHMCALRTSGQIECILEYCYYNYCDYGQADPPSGTFTHVAANGDYTCAIRTDGTLACWGDSSYGKTTPPAGTFVQLSLGEDHACARRADGTVACWGRDQFGDTEVPAGTFVKVSAGNDFTCAVKSDSSIQCWGASDHGVPAPPAGTYVAIDSTATTGCAIRSDGTLTCWGDEGSDPTDSTLPPAGTFIDVSLETRFGCGIKTGGALACWGSSIASPPSGTFTRVVTGDYHGCALRADGTVACWGDDSDDQATPPFGPYQQISAAGDHSCGLRTDGTIVCWGAPYAAPQPAGIFTEVAAGNDAACALRTDGSVACWGSDNYRQATPPSQLFERVYAADQYACGMRADGVVQCWGRIVR